MTDLLWDDFQRNPHEIIDTYDLKALVDDQGWIYMRTENGMFGLKQARIIDNQELLKHMAPFGYHPVKQTPGLFSLCHGHIGRVCVSRDDTQMEPYVLTTLYSQ